MKNKLYIINSKKGEIKKQVVLIGLLLISIILLIIVVSALTDDERAGLQNELNSLQENLTDSGYSWLVNYSVNYINKIGGIK